MDEYSSKNQLISPQANEYAESNKIVAYFGSKSSLYSQATNILEQIWVCVDSSTKKYLFSKWERFQLQLYGEVSKELFFTHTYLVWLMRVIRHVFFEMPSLGKYSQDDIFSWIWNNSDLANEFIQLLMENVSSIFRLETVDGDLFKDLYEDLINKGLRVRRGEYNTPDWLAQLILNRVLSRYTKLVPPRIIDPACGTGTFLFHAARRIVQRWGSIEPENLVGIDINPVMVEIAKTNYLLAINDTKTDGMKIDYQIPVFCFDTLQSPLEYTNLQESFDIVVGNPPWGSLRDIKNVNYQNFIKNLAVEMKLINKRDTHLFTQIEIATVFYIHCLKFLKRKGVIAFIMPRSVIIPTMQNYKFIRAKGFGFRFIEILDLEGISPLFNMPACVLIGEKNGVQTYPIKMVKYYTSTDSTNIRLKTLNALMPYLKTVVAYYNPLDLDSSRVSGYYYKFRTGVSIFPRSFYFIDIIDVLNGMIKAKSSDEIVKRFTKEPWKVVLEGLVEKDFLYYTLLAWEILPYSYIRLRPVILPIIKEKDKFKLIKIEDMVNLGVNGLANWFKKVDLMWRVRRTSASEKRFPSIFDRLNYGNLLDHQSPRNRFVVLYNATGSDLTSCIVDRQALPPLFIRSNIIKPVDFVADVKSWLYETNNLNEALYLCGVLNSDVVNELIKPLQPRGLGGARAIHRRPLLLNIPVFEPDNELHKAIAKYAKLNIQFVKSQKTIRISRKNVRRTLPYQKNINELVKKLLGVNHVSR